MDLYAFTSLFFPDDYDDKSYNSYSLKKNLFTKSMENLKVFLTRETVYESCEYVEVSIERLQVRNRSGL